MRLCLGSIICLLLVTAARPLPCSAMGLPGAYIQDPTCDLIGRETYRLDYRVSGEAGAVEVWVSSRADRIDSARPVLEIQQPPAEVSVAGRPGRVYFHLKPAVGAVRVVSVRRLPLEGATNFRDLGGYRASDGRYVRWGLVYRSGQLVNLTARDYEYLDRLGIRLVCDVRTESERLAAPTHWGGKLPEFLKAPMGEDRDVTRRQEQLRQRLSSPSAQTLNTPGRYDTYVAAYAGQYGAILRRLAAGDLPALEHCSAGKDRTGIFSAILLTALGVPREVVMQDYLLTNQCLLGPDSIEKTRADLQKLLGLSQLPDAAAVRAIMTARSETLESALDTINRNYGSFAGYLKQGLRLEDSDVAALRERLLEP
jgi:protein-tyrosine phosphatase